MADRELKVIITGDASSLQRAMGKASKTGSGLSRSLRNLGKVAAVGVGAAFVGLAATLKVGFGEMEDGQKVAAQTAAVLKSTGGEANVTAKQVDSLSQSLSQMSGVDDEVIGAGENMLLTFTNIRNEVGKGNDVFNQATKTVLDMSVALGKDMNASAIMVGKALQDPVHGLTALGKAGVDVRGPLADTVKHLVDIGDTAGAQKAILAELNKEFGGSAKAFGETLPGQVDKLKNSFSEMSGAIVTQLLPYFQQFLDWTNRNMPTIQKIIQGTMTAIIATINFLAPIIARLIGWFQQLSDAAHRYWPMVQEAAQRVVRWYQGTLAPAIENVLTAIKAFWNRFGADITKIAQKYFGVVLAIVQTILGNIASVMNILMAVIRGDWGKAWSELKEIPVRTLRGIAAAISGLASIFFTAAAAIGRAIIDGVLSGLSGLFDAVKDKIVGAVSGALSWARGHMGSTAEEHASKEIGMPVAKGVLMGWLEGTRDLPQNLADSTRKAIEAAAKAVTDARGMFASAFSDLSSAALAEFDKLTQEFETKTEKQMRVRDENRAAKDRQQALKDAKAALGEARSGFQPVEGETPEEAAKREKDKGDAILAAQQQIADAEFAIARAKNEKKAEDERAAYDNSRERQRRHFEQQLQALEAHAERIGMTANDMNQRLVALFRKYEVPFGKAAQNLMSALGDGIVQAGALVVKQASQIRDEIMKYLSSVQVRVNIDVVVPDVTDNKKNKPGRAAGGPVRAGQAYVVGEKGPEIFIPRGSGMIVPNGGSGMGGAGGINLTVNFPNYLGDADRAATQIQNLLLQKMRRSGNLGLA